MVVFYEFYIGLVVVVGLLGNTYCVRQLRTTNLKRYAFSCYLLALALSDTGFLATLALLTFYNMGIDLINLPAVCQMTHFLTYTCSFLSNWYILALSFERCLAVHRPLQSYTALLSGRSKVIVAAVTIFGILLNGWTLVFFDSEPDPSINVTSVFLANSNITAIIESDFVCQFRTSLVDYYREINTLDLAFSCALPLTGILILNCLIVREFCLANQLFRRRIDEAYFNSDSVNLRESVVMVTNGPHPIHIHSRRYRKKDIKVTVLLLGISATHLLLNLPSYIHRMVDSFIYPMENESSSSSAEEGSSIGTIVHLIFYTQYSVNFLLYSFSDGKLCFRFKR